MSTLDTLALDTACPLLADRVTVAWPSSGWAEPAIQHHGGLMGFSRLHPREHRAGFDTPTTKIRLVASEPFRLDDGQLGTHIPEMLARSPFGECDIIALRPNALHVVLPRTPPVAAGGAARLLAHIYTAHDDGTLLELQLYIDPDGLATEGVPAARRFALKLAATIASGPRTWARGPRTTDLAIPGAGAGQPALHVDLAPNFAVTLDQGPDFHVYRIVEFRPYDVARDPRLMVYLGGHPRMQGQPQREVKATIFGQLLPWRAWTEPGGGRMNRAREIIVALPGHDRIACHVRLDWETDDELATLDAMIQSLAAAARA